MTSLVVAMDSPLFAQSEATALRYIQRLQLTQSARYLLLRFAKRPDFRMGRLEAMFRLLVGPPPKNPEILPPHPSRPPLLIHSELPGIGRKWNIPDSVLRSLVTDRLEESFSEHLLLFTDRSVDSNRNYATAAVFIPALGYEFAEKPFFATTSTTAELVTMRLALQQLLLLRPPENAVILINYRVAVLQLQNEDQAGIIAQGIASLCQQR